jgi:hypothetical protein
MDRGEIRFRPVTERKSKFKIDEIAVDPDGPVPPAGDLAPALEEISAAVKAARRRGSPVVLCHGAHLVKNGLGPVVIRLVKEGWVTHVATNGAGSIHDWEFAFLGRSTEDVRENVARGEFGIWEETGAFLGLALHLGALEGLGYGEAVGRMVALERLRIPSRGEVMDLMARAYRELEAEGAGGARRREDEASPCDLVAAAADFLRALEVRECAPGELKLPHPWKDKSIQAAAYLAHVPLTVHPGIGYDIVYSHPLVRGGAVGRAAMVDFLAFAAQIRDLQGGVYLSVGSSIMSPMIFEKSLSMARNVLGQRGRKLDDFDIIVNDLAGATWDWSQGEPPATDPAYYVRFCKSFSRMGGRLAYVGVDNRIFLHNLYARLRA